MTIISYPIPAYSNVPIEPQFYQPSQFFISAIALGKTTVITTTTNVNYVVGQLVRLIIPQYFGCRQLNEKQGYVLSIPSANQIEVNINSSQNVDPYINSTYTTKPQILAIGDINNGLISSTGRVLLSTNIPGSFINISPL
jgi:hypothetical protein